MRILSGNPHVLAISKAELVGRPQGYAVPPQSSSTFEDLTGAILRRSSGSSSSYRIALAGYPQD